MREVPLDREVNLDAKVSLDAEAPKVGMAVMENLAAAENEAKKVSADAQDPKDVLVPEEEREQKVTLAVLEFAERPSVDPQVALGKRDPKEIAAVLDLKVVRELGESLVAKVRLEETALVERLDNHFERKEIPDNKTLSKGAEIS